jgi:outer membrane receptor protein involved in Fe transport
MNTVVMGAEIERRENTDNDLLAPYTAPTTFEEVWAIFVNDTIKIDRLTVTPGLRYDHISITDDEINPSLGLTFQVNDTTLLRGNVSRGFRKPPPSVKAGDPYFDITNPELESETIWSYQVGAETTAIPFLHLKTTLFDHQASDVWVRDPDTWALVNDGDYERQGVEVSLQTESWHNLSLNVNGMYVYQKPDQEQNDAHYTANVLLEYNDSTWQAQLFGHYLKLGDVDPPVMYEAETDTILWDAVIQRKIFIREGLQADLFAALHNILDEEQYASSYFPNAPRWFEAGIRLKF